jgi:hypothetical protein
VAENGKHPVKQRPRYRLDGHSLSGDKRTTPIRGDLADIKLAGKLFAPHYAVPMLRRCIASTTPMHSAPDLQSNSESALIYGEDFAVLDIAGIWAWGYSCHDDYLGYVHISHLGEPLAPSHFVMTEAAVIQTEPNLRAPELMRVPMGSRLACGETSADGKYFATGGGFVSVQQVIKIGEVKGGIADIAESLIGVPYHWGGRSGDSIDCSGLVQLCFGLKGVPVPRDSDMQLAAIGEVLPEGEPLLRGDLVFFPGHVGIMADAENIINANAASMNVKVEPLAATAARYPDAEQPILARKRVNM